MSKITLDQAKIDMYINLLERGAAWTFMGT